MTKTQPAERPIVGVVHESKVGTYHPAPCMDTPCPGGSKYFSPQVGCDRTDPHCVCAHGTPCNGVAWTINDTRGYVDAGPACDECGACECLTINQCAHAGCVTCQAVAALTDQSGDARRSPSCTAHSDASEDGAECIGLAFAFVCLDGGESLCESCAAKAGVVIEPCDCE